MIQKIKQWFAKKWKQFDDWMNAEGYDDGTSWG
jgi:hypothetical protein